MLKQSIDKRNQASGGTSTEGDDDNGPIDIEGDSDYGKKAPPGRKTPARRFRYSMQEEKQMWDYFLREYRAGNKSAKIKTTLQLWKEFVEQEKPDKAKKPSGMESHFRRQMLPNVMKYKKFMSDDDFFLVLRHFEIRIKPKNAKKLEKNFTYRVETHSDGTFKNAFKNSEEEALRLRLEDARNPQALLDDTDDSDVDNSRATSAMSKVSDDGSPENSKRKRGRPPKVKLDDTLNATGRTLKSAKSNPQDLKKAEADTMTSQLSTPIADEKSISAAEKRSTLRKRAATPYKASALNKDSDEPAPKRKPSDKTDGVISVTTSESQRTSARYAPLQSMHPPIVFDESPTSCPWSGCNYPTDEDDVYANSYGYINPKSSAISKNSDAYYGGFVQNATYASWSATCVRDSLYGSPMYALPPIAQVLKQNSAALASPGSSSAAPESLKVSEQSAFQRVTPSATPETSPVITLLEDDASAKPKVSVSLQPRKSKLTLEIVSVGSVEYRPSKLDFVKLEDITVLPASNDENKKPESEKNESNSSGAANGALKRKFGPRVCQKQNQFSIAAAILNDASLSAKNENV